MARDPDELVVASQGDLYVADVGTSLPSSATASISSFEQLGYITEDGATFSRNIDIEEFMAWQQRLPVRREITGEEVTVSCELEQWNEDTFALAFGGGSVTEDSPGVYTYEFPTGALLEKTVVLRWSDGDKDYQLGLERATVSDEVEVELNRSNLAVFPVAFKALGGEDGESSGVVFTTNDPAFDIT